METLERLNKLKEIFKSKDFQSNRGISNQIGVYIFAYPAKDEIKIEAFTEQIKKEKEFNIYEYDLYKYFLSVCENKKILNSISSMEEKKGKDFILSQLSKIATPEMFIEKLNAVAYKPGDIILLTGVGRVNPFMRVHAILEKTQNLFRDTPIVVMYPGTYDGHELHLFNKFRANHYRSFNLL